MSCDIGRPQDSSIQQAVELSKTFPYITRGFQSFLEELESSSKITYELLKNTMDVIRSSSRTFDSTVPTALRVLQLLRITYNSLSESEKKTLAAKRTETTRDVTKESESDVNLFCMLTEEGLLPIVKATGERTVESFPMLSRFFESGLTIGDHGDARISSYINVSSVGLKSCQDDDIILVDSPKEEMSQINVVDLTESQQDLTTEAYQSKIMENNYAKVEMKSIIQPIREKQMQEDDKLQCTGGGDITSTAKRKKKHHCTSCSQSFKTKIGLQDHLGKLHIQDISMFDKLSDIVYGLPLSGIAYLCPSCVAAFESEDRHSEHMNLHEKSPASPLLMCDYCSTVLVNHDMMDKHLGEQGHGLPRNGNPGGSFIATELWCTECSPNLVFCTEAGYYLHVEQAHNREIFFFCKKCLMGSCDSKLVWDHIMSGVCTQKMVYERTLGMCVASDIHFQPIDEETNLKKPTYLFVTPHNCAGRTFIRFGSRFATCGEVENGRKCLSLQNFFRYENYIARKNNNFTDTLFTDRFPPRNYVDSDYTMYAYLRFINNQGVEPQFKKHSSKQQVKFKVPRISRPSIQRIPPVVARPSIQRIPPRVTHNIPPNGPVAQSPNAQRINYRPLNPQLTQGVPILHISTTPLTPVEFANSTVRRSASSPSMTRTVVSTSHNQSPWALRDVIIRKIAILKDDLAREEAKLKNIEENIGFYNHARSNQ